MKKTVFLTLIISCLLPSLSLAEGYQDASGFMTGFTHPILGFDHLLAMLSVGILSALLGGRAIWTVPLAFVIFMLIGGIMGLNHLPIFSVELCIALSVLFLGLAIAFDSNLPIWLALAAVGFFAIFHGYAHGTEIPFLVKPENYVSGFIAGTTLIHLAGVGIGVITEKLTDGRLLLRFLGAAIAGIGFHLLILP